ncbi:MAG: 6-carboxytetrahydropterin synthase [Deltaproteobacteria bacterium]|nr:6-carboxytetrahydropterin synthase [Deltaproteobacteria bacterium]
MIRTLRRYEFSAAHVLARSDWSDERNRAVYGKCANPAGHGHNYRFELTLEGAGPSGDALDAIVRSRVLDELDARLLNREVAAFRLVVPTAENIARHIWDTLCVALEPARLTCVRLIETGNNSVEYFGS